MPEPLPSSLLSHLLLNSLSSLPKQNEVKICITVDLHFLHHNGNSGKQQQRQPDEAATLITIAVLLANATLATVNNYKITPHTMAMAMAIAAPAVEVVA